MKDPKHYKFMEYINISIIQKFDYYIKRFVLDRNAKNSIEINIQSDLKSQSFFKSTQYLIDSFNEYLVYFECSFKY